MQEELHQFELNNLWELVIRLQRIYNILLFHAVILSFLDVLQSFYSNFISFLALTY